MATKQGSARSKRLKQARALRHHIALQERALSSGRLHVEDVLGTPSATQGHMSIYRVLRATRSIGEVTAREIIQSLGLWPHDHLAQLSPKQRQLVIDALPDRVRRNSTD